MTSCTFRPNCSAEQFGLLHPLQRASADFAAAGGEQLVRSCVAQILGTVGASDATPGEIPWRTDFGSLLHQLRHPKNDSVLQELGRVYVVDALKRWEPRIVVTAVMINRNRLDSENVLAIRIRYDVIAANALGNHVVLSNVAQDVIVASNRL